MVEWAKAFIPAVFYVPSMSRVDEYGISRACTLSASSGVHSHEGASSTWRAGKMTGVLNSPFSLFLKEVRKMGAGKDELWHHDLERNSFNYFFLKFY